MKGYILILGLVLLGACGENKDEYGDYSDLPEGAVIDSYEHDEDLKRVSVYSGSYVIEQGDYYKGRRHGTWIVYQPNTSNISSMTTFVNGKKNGVHLKMTSNGASIEEKIYFKNDLPHGKYLKYAFTRIEEERSYVNGQLDGMVVKYYPNGNRMEESPFVNGLRHGIARWYDQEGNLTIEYAYENGVLIPEE